MNEKKIITIISILFIFTVFVAFGAGGDSVDCQPSEDYIVDNTNREEIEKLLDTFWVQLKSKYEYEIKELNSKRVSEYIRWGEGNRYFRISYVYVITDSPIQKIYLTATSQSSIWKKRKYNNFYIDYNFTYWEFSEAHSQQRESFAKDFDSFLKNSNLSVRKIDTNSKEAKEWWHIK